ncbi:hypothetical protein GTA08_BOTSDO06435 [Neofusicoccum parvum]|nr:hypothetical protein GTA08_BOTSDO06435 [Neofusicoccum parvum]
MVQLGPQMQAMTGGYYDLVSFDPRGAGKTIPLSCYQNDAERINATLLNPYVNGNASDTTPGRLWASGENFATACYENGKDIGGLLGMAFTARDIIRVVDALGDEDGLLRYYGLSGGTVQGATLVAMFPERMDRVILDGVWNIHEYNHYHAVEGFADTDKTFSGFLSACITAGEKCALSQLNTTAPELEKAIYELIENVKYRPIAYQGTMIDYTIVRNVIFLSLTVLAQWPPMATFLHALLTGNVTELDTRRNWTTFFQ